MTSDNGGEFIAAIVAIVAIAAIAAIVKQALEAVGATPAFIAPGSPCQNGFADSFWECVTLPVDQNTGEGQAP